MPGGRGVRPARRGPRLEITFGLRGAVLKSAISSSGLPRSCPALSRWRSLIFTSEPRRSGAGGSRRVELSASSAEQRRNPGGSRHLRLPPATQPVHGRRGQDRGNSSWRLTSGTRCKEPNLRSSTRIQRPAHLAAGGVLRGRMLDSAERPFLVRRRRGRRSSWVVRLRVVVDASASRYPNNDRTSGFPAMGPSLAEPLRRFTPVG